MRRTGEVLGQFLRLIKGSLVQKQLRGLSKSLQAILQGQEKIFLTFQKIVQALIHCRCVFVRIGLAELAAGLEAFAKLTPRRLKFLSEETFCSTRDRVSDCDR